MAAGNVSETIYMAESLYLRFDIPIIMPDVLEALKAKGFDMSNINTTHVFFTVSPSQRRFVGIRPGFGCQTCAGGCIHISTSAPPTSPSR